MPLQKLGELAGILFNDAETRRSSQQAINTGRSWWAVRYSWLDGWWHEWDRDPASPNGHRDWPLLPRKGKQAVRLYCPNGKFAQLGDTHDATGKLFQLKQRVRHTVVGLLGPGAVSDEVLCQLIGMITGLNGQCVLYAWEPLPAPEIPSDAPKPPKEEEWIAKSAEPGLYELAVQQWHKDTEEYFTTPQYKAWERRFNTWKANAGGRLVGPIEDNVYNIRYKQIGAVKADVLGIDDGEGR